MQTWLKRLWPVWVAAVVIIFGWIAWLQDAPARKRKAEWSALVESNRVKLEESHKALEAKCGPFPAMCVVGLKAIPCAVKATLAATLHDPASLALQEPCETRDDGDGWLAACSYRARNTFGAMTLERHVFKIRDGKIVYVN